MRAHLEAGLDVRVSAYVIVVYEFLGIQLVDVLWLLSWQRLPVLGD